MKVRWPFISQTRDREMSDEMQFHIESKTRELMDTGMSDADARLEARRRFGSVLKQKETGQDLRGDRWTCPAPCRAGRTQDRPRPRHAHLRLAGWQSGGAEAVNPCEFGFHFKEANNPVFHALRVDPLKTIGV